MDPNAEKATIREVYSLIEEMRKEITGSINRLENKFDTLEAGRLSTLETKFANLQGRMAIVAGVISVLISMVFIFLNHYLAK